MPTGDNRRDASQTRNRTDAQIKIRSYNLHTNCPQKNLFSIRDSFFITNFITFIV